MQIASYNGDTTLYLERGEQHAERVVGRNRVHVVFDAAGHKVYTYVDIEAAAPPFRSHVRIQWPWHFGWHRSTAIVVRPSRRLGRHGGDVARGEGLVERLVEKLVGVLAPPSSLLAFFGGRSDRRHRVFRKRGASSSRQKRKNPSWSGPIPTSTTWSNPAA